MNGKKLFRSVTNRKLCGVCGGVGEYFNIDPTLVRLLWAVLCIPTFFTAIFVYIVAAIVMPEPVE